MKRRDLLKTVAAGTALSVLGAPGARIVAAAPEYQGRLLITLQADGGWDVTSFCDPKSNQGGEPDINAWARRGEVQQAGNITYAPYGSNALFFDKYHQDMLVINGVDAQTNAHTVGITRNWSGRGAFGLPTLTALFAARNARDLPLSYVNYGGFAETARLIRYSRMDNTDALLGLLDPNRMVLDRGRQWRAQAELDLVNRYQQAAQEQALNSQTLTPLQRENLSAYMESRNGQEDLKRLEAVLPPAEQIEPDANVGAQLVNLRRQIQLTLLTFKAGIGAASDLFMPGFDTHEEHDGRHEPLLAHLAESVDFLWEYANQLGIAERITLVIASDFGRTPLYNSENGKDHWPIGSMIVMEQGARWGNRVVGLTDGGHNALRINPQTLKEDRDGILVFPEHVHQALRMHLGLAGYSARQGFTFNNVEDLDLFNPSLSTV